MAAGHEKVVNFLGIGGIVEIRKRLVEGRLGCVEGRWRVVEGAFGSDGEFVGIKAGSGCS